MECTAVRRLKNPEVWSIQTKTPFPAMQFSFSLLQQDVIPPADPSASNSAGSNGVASPDPAVNDIISALNILDNYRCFHLRAVCEDIPPSRPARFILCVDTSGSMGQCAADLRNCLSDFVRDTRPAHTVTLILFNDAASVVESDVKMDEYGKKRLLASIRDITCNSSTNYELAIDAMRTAAGKKKSPTPGVFRVNKSVVHDDDDENYMAIRSKPTSDSSNSGVRRVINVPHFNQDGAYEVLQREPYQSDTDSVDIPATCLFFTDGEPTLGICSHTALVACMKNRMTDCHVKDVHVFGFRSQVNSGFLKQLTYGNGTYFYSDSGKDLLRSFRDATFRLLNMGYTGVTATVTFDAGIRISEFYTPRDVKKTVIRDDKEVVFHLGDFALGDSKDIVGVFVMRRVDNTGQEDESYAISPTQKGALLRRIAKVAVDWERGSEPRFSPLEYTKILINGARAASSCPVEVSDTRLQILAQEMSEYKKGANEKAEARVTTAVYQWLMKELCAALAQLPPVRFREVADQVKVALDMMDWLKSRKSAPRRGGVYGRYEHDVLKESIKQMIAESESAVADDHVKQSVFSQMTTVGYTDRYEVLKTNNHASNWRSK